MTDDTARVRPGLRPADPLARPGRWQLPVVGGLVLLVMCAEAGRWYLASRTGAVTPQDIGSSIASLVLAVLGGLVVRRGEAARYGWLMLAMAVVVSSQGLASWYAGLAWIYRPEVDWPLATTAAWYQDWWMVPWLLGFLLLPALFPDGRAPSPRWGRPVRAATVAWVLLIVAFMTLDRELTGLFEGNPLVPDPPRNPTGFWSLGSEEAGDAVIGLPWIVVTLASVVIGIGCVVTRWRRADATSRRQLGLVMASIAVLLTVVGVTMLHTLVEQGLGVRLLPPLVLDIAFGAAAATWSLALGLAALRFRLYDVDRVVNRTIVYGVLSVGLLATYALVVVFVGSFVPAEWGQTAALLAMVVVALAFDPVRRRVQATVNRLMFGRRDDPYVVLARLGEAMARSGDPVETLQRVADGVATSLRLPWVAIELQQRSGRAVVASHGSADGAPGPRVRIPLVHGDQVVGHLLAAQRSVREALSGADRRLLEDVAHQAGAVAATARLTEDLQRSREGLVLAREEERRRLRRDLHDGLGPSLAAQTLALDAAYDRVADDPEAALAMLLALKRETQQLVAEIRRLVNELRPPTLDELGLAGALVAHVATLDATGSLAIRIRTDPDPLPELSAATEVAAYRIASEAVTNALRHAEASRCDVLLAVEGTRLRLRVTDDGIGLPVVPRPGVGLTSMRERAEELGGTLTATDANGGGVEVVATLPLAPVTTPVTDRGHATEAEVDRG